MCELRRRHRRHSQMAIGGMGLNDLAPAANPERPTPPPAAYCHLS